MPNKRLKSQGKNNLVKKIIPGDIFYPKGLKSYFSKRTPPIIFAIGNLELLKHKKLALFCSVKCPGHLILKAHDLSQSLKEAGATVIGGFHSPIERECLRILLRGSQPIIICPARSPSGMRMRVEYKKAFEKGRLLLLSPFKETERRNTVETAMERNRFIAALADAVFVAHASPNSKTELFCRELLTWGKRLYTFESDSNTHLIRLGAKPIKNLEHLLTPGQASKHGNVNASGKCYGGN
jgi:predicted Rossmann fold nucleotide-binding protein DprA/Smf involved in DNA uptake